MNLEKIVENLVQIFFKKHTFISFILIFTSKVGQMALTCVRKKKNRRLRARRALTLFNDVPLTTRRALSP